MEEKIEENRASRSKHYTPAEKNLFLQILYKYKQVIECKKNNTNTLREKEVAWNSIYEFNNSSLITQERNIQHLKKLWTNIKQTQRDIITKEKQARFATGGGTEILSTELDPEVALIAPDLMTTAPVLFSSNMNYDEIKAQRQVMKDIIEFEEIIESNINKENTKPTISHKTNVSTFKEIKQKQN